MTSPPWRGARAALPMVAGAVLFGLATGAAMAPSGLSLSVILAAPLAMYAGVAQLAYAQLVAAGAPFVSLLAIVALTHVRYLVYATVASTWPRSGGWIERCVAPYLLTETSFALALLQPPAERVRFMMGAGMTLGAAWFSSCAAGALLAAQLPPIKHVYAVPVIVLAPILARLARERRHLAVGLAASAAGVALAGLPHRLGPLAAAVCAVAAVMAFGAVRRGRR